MNDYKDNEIPEEIKRKAETRKELEKIVDKQKLDELTPDELIKLANEKTKEQLLRELKEREIAKVEVTNQPEIKTEKVEFPDVQKVSVIREILAKITNFPAFPEFMKIGGKVDVDFPETQKVQGKVDVDFPDVQKVHIENQNETVKVEGLPIGKTEEYGLPDNYIPVRLTDGKNFYSAISAVAGSLGKAIKEYFVDSTGKGRAALVDADGHQQVDLVSGNVTIDASDIQIGAVELKDATTTNRATIDSNGNLAVSILEPANVDGQVSISGTLPNITGINSNVNVNVHPVTISGTVNTNATITEPLNVDGQISISGTLPAGSNAIGKLAANDGVDVGDVTINNAAGASAVNIQDGGNSITIDGTVSASNAAGDVAHDSADSGNPVKIGAKAVLFDASAPPNAAAAENDRVNIIADEYGRQFVETTHPNYFDVSADYAAAQTNATVKAAPGAGLSLYITDILISNGATAGNITLLDGSGGTVLWEIYPAINGGCSSNLRTPIKLTANTLLAITSTTVTTHSVTICGFTAP